MFRVVFLIVACAACVQKPPQALVVVHPERAPKSHAALVMPVKCMTYADTSMCNAAVWSTNATTQMGRSSQGPQTFDAYIAPALRLKLEFAGFTLAEAAAMRIATADRVEVNGEARIEDMTPGPQTVGQLAFEDARAVARSLALPSMLIPTFTIRRAGRGEVSGELVVVLLDVETNLPRWTVTCKETLYDAFETSSRLANCVGNGVLAVLAPENLIGQAL